MENKKVEKKDNNVEVIRTILLQVGLILILSLFCVVLLNTPEEKMVLMENFLRYALSGTLVFFRDIYKQNESSNKFLEKDDANHQKNAK